MNYRQGDIALFKIDKIPAKAKKLKDKVLAYGEATGYSHRFENPDLVERYEKDGRFFLRVLGTTTLIHEEHKPLIIEKGDYEQIEEREYDPFMESIEKVLD